MNKKSQMKILIVTIIIVLIILFSIQQIYNYSQKHKKGRLETLLLNLIDETNLKNGDCLSYTLYYKDFLNENYPKLDVRKIDRAGICPIGTKECGEMEGIPHTYLIVNGYGAECILDQKNVICIQIRG